MTLRCRQREEAGKRLKTSENFFFRCLPLGSRAFHKHCKMMKLNKFDGNANRQSGNWNVIALFQASGKRKKIPSITLITFIVYDSHIKIIFAWIVCCALINNDSILLVCSANTRGANVWIWIFIDFVCVDAERWKHLCQRESKDKWCNIASSSLLQLATAIPLDHLEEHAITHRGNVLARMAWRVWRVIDVLEAISKVVHTLLHASVSCH